MERSGSNAMKDRTLEIKFLGSTEADQRPKVALYTIEQGGNIRKIKSIEGGKINLSDLSGSVKEGASYGFGPDIDEKDVTKKMLVAFRPSQKISEWANTGVIEINPRWRDWLVPFVCVHGDVHRCRPIYWWLDIAAQPSLLQAATAAGASAAKTTAATSMTAAAGSKATSALRSRLDIGIIRPPIEIPQICAPICNAVVEVYEKTCCCHFRPPFDDLLDRLREILETIPPIPDPDPGPLGPWPEVGPTPGPDPAPIRAIKMAKLMRATGSPIPLGNPPEKLGQDFYALSAMTTVSERQAYIDDHYYLYPIFCTCSTRKVGETAVDQNGEFSFCHRRPITPFRCRITYYYKVRQWQGNQWVYIYDGSTTNDYFGQSDDAHLKTWKGRACDPGDGVPDPGSQFVMLENIGVIPSWHLASPVQDIEFGVNTPGATDGLVNYNYTGQPWAQTLSFRLKFTEGMKGLGAKYYRVSVVKANSNGDAAGTPLVLTNPVAWSRWKWIGPQLQTETVGLGPNTVGSNSGLYLIPYESDAPDGGWLWFQFHQSWNTLQDPISIVDDNYLVIVEVFDAAGSRLRPNGATGAGTDKPFTFRRWSTETTTDAVNFAALTHLFHVNNVSCYGDIVDLRKNGVPSIEECQFIQGCANDNFSVGFYAFHANKFMASYSLWYHRGLSGPNVTIETGTSNAPASIPPVPVMLDSSNAKQSNSKTFDSMLETHPKCSFAVELRVYPKHTNGMGIVAGYGASDTAAFALEKVPCIDLSPPPLLRTETMRPVEKQM